MRDFDEEALREINNIDAARLAIRGALATIRDLQDQNARFRAELQDAASQRKALDARIGDMSQQLQAWQRRAEEWEAAEKRRASDEARLKNNLRIEVRAEERARVEDYQRRMDEELGALRAQLETMVRAQLQKEEAWGQVKKTLERREAELLQTEREKGELAARYAHDAEMLGQLRETRDREISASIKDLQLQLEDREREAGALRRENDDLRKVVTAAQADLELKLKEKEEKLLRGQRLKEQSLQERYAKRELELQSSWADLENGLWQRSKDARDKLDAAAAQQFEERARALADRQQQMEAEIAQKRKALEEEFERRCADSESRYAGNELKLLEGWAEKERNLLQRFEDELAKERRQIEESYTEKIKAVETEGERLRQSCDERRSEIEAEHKHLAGRLLEEQARQEAERLRLVDDFVAKKTAELEMAYGEKVSALLSESRRIEADLRDKHVARMAELEKEAAEAREQFAFEKTDWIARQQMDAKAAHDALLKQMEDRERQLEEKFRARDAELTTLQRSLELEYKTHKAEIESRHAEREKNLDKQWAAREAELVRRYEARLAEQRATLHAEHDGKIDGLRTEIEQRLTDSYASREKQLLLHQQSLLHEAQESGRFAVEAAQGEAAASIKLVRNELQARLDEWRNRADRAASENAELKKSILEHEQLARKAVQELSERERLWTAEKLDFEQSARKREVEREQRYQELERRLQELWTKKEAEAVGSRLQSLESQHSHYLEQTAKSEEGHRKAFEEWKRNAEADLAKQKEQWLLARESDLAEKRRLLEDDFSRRVLQVQQEAVKREEDLRRRQDDELARARAELDKRLREREEELTNRFTEQEKRLASDWESRRRQLEDELLAKAAEERHLALERLKKENDARVEREIERRAQEREAEMLKANERWLAEQKRKLGGDKPS